MAIVAPPWIPIPPPAYGGIEQVVALQAQVLAEAGHDVTLVAAAGSRIDGVRCVAPIATVPTTIGGTVPEWLHTLGALRACDGADVIIDHSGPLGALLAASASVPVLHVTHGPFDAETTPVYDSLAALAPDVGLVAISDAQRRTAPHLPWTAVCHNAIDVTDIPFRSHPDGYLAFLGRMAPEKGAAEAIAIARACGRPIMLAAKCREPKEQAYFDRAVAPHLGPDVVWLGELGPADKFALLAGAAALVFPIDWEEPFGMVMIEAMACGTPVLATRRGAVPEVVVDGVTGYVRDSPAELAECVTRLTDLDRSACRRHVAARFDRDAMAETWSAVVARAARAEPARRHHNGAGYARRAGTRTLSDVASIGAVPS